MNKSSKQIIFRDGVPADFDQILGIYNHYVVHSPVTFDTELQTPSNRQSWFDAFFAHDNAPGKPPIKRHFLVVAETNSESTPKILGYAASHAFRPKPAYDSSVETSVYCDASFMGQGLGTALYEALITRLRGAPVHRAYALITTPNAASIRLHEKFGFAKAGVLREAGYKHDRYWDVEIFELQLGHQHQSQLPVPDKA